MENASKALLMAAGVLIALMTIGLLVIMFNAMSNTQKEGIQVAREAQVIEFNNQFTTYLRDEVRGSDMISLMNRVVDYNARKGDNSDEKYQQINLTVNGIKVSKETVLYDENDPKLVKSTYTQDNIGEFLEKVRGKTGLETKYGSKYITNLSSNIAQVMDSEEKAQKFLPKTLSTYGGYEQVKKDTAQYYQYSQFKRLYFNCNQNATKYNNQTGRIISMEFTCTNKLG